MVHHIPRRCPRRRSYLSSFQGTTNPLVSDDSWNPRTPEFRTTNSESSGATTIAVTLFTGIPTVSFTTSDRNPHGDGLHIGACFGMLHLGRTHAIGHRNPLHVLSNDAALRTEPGSCFPIFGPEETAFSVEWTHRAFPTPQKTVGRSHPRGSARPYQTRLLTSCASRSRSDLDHS